MAYRNEIMALLSASSQGLSGGVVVASVVAAAGNLPAQWQFAVSSTLTAGTKTEKLRAPTTTTWEDLGVPAGSTIGSVQLLGANAAVSGVSGLALTQSLKLRIVGPDGVSVLASDMLISSLPFIATARYPLPSQTAVNVLPSAQNSASQIGLEAESAVVSALGGLSALTTQVDSILVRVNYVAPDVTPPTALVVSLGDM